MDEPIIHMESGFWIFTFTLQPLYAAHTGFNKIFASIANRCLYAYVSGAIYMPFQGEAGEGGARAFFLTNVRIERPRRVRWGLFGGCRLLRLHRSILA
jgi:hypothetical protein